MPGLAAITCTHWAISPTREFRWLGKTFHIEGVWVETKVGIGARVSGRACSEVKHLREEWVSPGLPQRGWHDGRGRTRRGWCQISDQGLDGYWQDCDLNSRWHRKLPSSHENRTYLHCGSDRKVDVGRTACGSLGRHSGTTQGIPQARQSRHTQAGWPKIPGKWLDSRQGFCLFRCLSEPS